VSPKYPQVSPSIPQRSLYEVAVVAKKSAQNKALEADHTTSSTHAIIPQKSHPQKHI